MEYFLGSVITLLIVYVVYRKIVKDYNEYVPASRIRYSQSHIYTTIASAMSAKSGFFLPRIRKQTQASKYVAKKEVRVVFYNDTAYWIADNTLYSANIVNGIIDQDSKKVVDTMGIDRVELDKLSIIVEKLTEEPIDDNRNSGNEKLF